MSLDPQSLQKLLIEMDNQLNKSRAELNMCNLQLERVDANLKIIESTTSRLNKLTSPGDKVWKGIGKAFVQNDVSEYLVKIGEDKKQFAETEKLLKTKKHYLEANLEKTIQNMTEIVGKK